MYCECSQLWIPFHVVFPRVHTTFWTDFEAYALESTFTRFQLRHNSFWQHVRTKSPEMQTFKKHMLYGIKNVSAFSNRTKTYNFRHHLWRHETSKTMDRGLKTTVFVPHCFFSSRNFRCGCEFLCIVFNRAIVFQSII